MVATHSLEYNIKQKIYRKRTCSMQSNQEPYYESIAKISRAKKLINELKIEVETYFKNNSLVNTINDENNSLIGQSEIIFIFKFQQIPHEIRTIIGDIIHNIRSSLDIAACETARRNNNSDKNVYFPFSESEEKLDESIHKKKFYRAGEKAILVIKEIKPFKCGNILLRAIHDLDVTDKHKLLLPVPVQLESPAIMVKDENGMPIPPIVMPGHGKATLIFSNDTDIAGREIIPTLIEMISISSDIIGKLNSTTCNNIKI